MTEYRAFPDAIQRFIQSEQERRAKAADAAERRFIEEMPVDTDWDNHLVELAPDGSAVIGFWRKDEPVPLNGIPAADRWIVHVSRSVAMRVKFPLSLPALTSYAVHERHRTALEIVNAVELQATDYRAAYRLPDDHRFSVTFPPNEEIGRDVFELAETALNHRGIDVDWGLWPPKQ